MPTTAMQVSSFRMSFSRSQSGSPASAGKSLYAMQIVLSPSQAIGSITLCTISSRSFGLNTQGWPWESKIREHLGEGEVRSLTKEGNPSTHQLMTPTNPFPQADGNLWVYLISLTFSGWSLMLLCCTFGIHHQRSSVQCSWTCGRSWRYKPYRASLLEFLLWLADSPSLVPAPGQAEHTQSCCPHGVVAHLLFLEAENAQWFECYVMLKLKTCFVSLQRQWVTFRWGSFVISLGIYACFISFLHFYILLCISLHYCV